MEECCKIKKLLDSFTRLSGVVSFLPRPCFSENRLITESLAIEWHNVW